MGLTDCKELCRVTLVEVIGGKPLPVLQAEDERLPLVVDRVNDRPEGVRDVHEDRFSRQGSNQRKLQERSKQGFLTHPSQNQDAKSQSGTSSVLQSPK